MFLKKGFKIVVMLFFFGVVLALFYTSLFIKKDFEPSVMIGKRIPNLVSSSLLSGQDLNLKDMINNEIFVVNIFASWCAPCQIEHPYLMKLKENNIKIIGVNYKDNDKNAKNFLKKNKNPYNGVLKDKNGELSIFLGAYGVPETFVINKNFIIIDKYIGPINDEFVNKVLNLK